MKVKPIIQIAFSQNITKKFTIMESPIWRAQLWIYDYIKTLPFMNDYDGEYNRRAVNIGSVIIDYVEYERASSIVYLQNNDKTWMLNPYDRSELWIHFEKSYPPSSFISFQTGVFVSFSFGNSPLQGIMKTLPFLLAIPTIEDSADFLHYQRMSFSTGSVSVDNSSGNLDQYFDLFGNDVNLMELTEDNELKMLRQYFIESYTVGLTQSSFSVKDKRARLAFNAPVDTYTLEKYSHIEENLVDKIVQDVYGQCIGVPGTCLNRHRIYINPPVNLDFNNWFEFKFARTLTSLSQVQVEMNNADGETAWTEVFPGLGIRQPSNIQPGHIINFQPTNPFPIRLVAIDDTGNDFYVLITTDSTIGEGPNIRVNHNELHLFKNDGRIAIWWSQAMQHNRGVIEGRNGNARKVKANGVFVNLHNPGDIIKDLMSYYGNIVDDEQNFNNKEWNEELGKLPPIGFCMDSSRSIFDWIERIQNSSLLGFQLLVDRELYTARVDNANREETFNIKWIEVVNKDEIEPELNGDNYASFTTINFNRDYADNEYQTHTNKNHRLEILDLYRFEKELKLESFLLDEEQVERKSNIILENFKRVRPVIRNIELEGLRW